MKKDILADLIPLLIEKGYKVFLPLSSSSSLAILLDNTLYHCLYLPVYYKGESKFVKLTFNRSGIGKIYKANSFDYLLAVDYRNNLIYMLKFSDIASFQTLHLTEKWDNYLLTESPKPPDSIPLKDFNASQLKSKFKSRLYQIEQATKREEEDRKILDIL